jgi:SAM-dependent methyltransferase
MPPAASLARITEERPEATYGDRIAEIYDERYAEKFADDTVATVAFLEELAGPGPVLELGIGTGRVAISLSEADVEVHGIDASEAMVARMRAKPGGDRIPVTIAGFADFSLETKYRVVYVVFNTFFGLLTQDEQMSGFRAVTRHLDDDGAFVMQAFVPDVTRFDVHNQRVSTESLTTEDVILEVSEHDPFGQRTDTAIVILSESGTRIYPVKLRYAYPSELDLTARLAGLRLRERWAGWDRSPYPGPAWNHVSVWERDPHT